MTADDTATDGLTARRARLRSTVAVAARVLPVHHPVSSFIAVNPLNGLEQYPFAEAVRRAGDLFGARGTLPEPTYRAAYAAGRISPQDLTAVLTRHYPHVLDAATVRLGDTEFTPLQVTHTDFLHGEPGPEPQRRHRTRSETCAPVVARTVDEQVSKWCAAFLGEDAGWAMPGRQAGCFPAWRALAARDRSLPRLVRAALRRVPERADDAVLQGLDLLEVPTDEHQSYLQAHLTRLPGWAAHVRWREQHRDDLNLLDYLAMRLTYESVLLPAVSGPHPADPPPMPSPMQRAGRVAESLGVHADDTQLAAAARILSAYQATERPLVWLQAYEHHYRDRLLTDLSTRPSRPAPTEPPAQVVFCIDVRSEGLRRRLEDRGGYATFGFAGFFAVPMNFRDLAGGASLVQSPALIDPRDTVVEAPVPGSGRAAGRRLAGLRAVDGAEHAFHTAKQQPLSPFALAEAAGWVAAPYAVAKTMFAGTTAALRHRLHRAAVPATTTELAVAGAISLDDRVLSAQAMLTTTGLVDGFAPLVVVCGHGSSTSNNPYQAALDCGACGGHSGGPNARAAATNLNDSVVREHLAQRGIHIPAGTWFVAAEHDTTTDQVVLLDTHAVPASHRDACARLTADLHAAGAALALERCATLPGTPRAARTDPAAAARHVATRAADWAQVYPEWGLAGNAAFIIGPRAMTVGLDLGRRAFLHSYDADIDADGTALETILTAPLVVAQWISHQYYFSTVEPDIFGAGTKTVHNVVGDVGVLSGPGGDLRLGLPWQSVADGDRLVHEPMRLLAVVQAPPALLQTVIERNPVLRRLFGGDWISLVVRADPGQPWQRHTAQGWQPWQPTRPSTDTPEGTS